MAFNEFLNAHIIIISIRIYQIYVYRVSQKKKSKYQINKMVHIGQKRKMSIQRHPWLGLLEYQLVVEVADIVLVVEVALAGIVAVVVVLVVAVAGIVVEVVAADIAVVVVVADIVVCIDHY
jgi:hypothetical protein